MLMVAMITVPRWNTNATRESMNTRMIMGTMQNGMMNTCNR